MQSVGVPSLAKIEYFPYNKSVLIIRLENIDDSFSHRYAIDYKKSPRVNVYELAKLLLAKITGGVLPTSYSLKIDEMSLSGNEEYQSMVWDKVKWQSDNDDYIDES